MNPFRTPLVRWLWGGIAVWLAIVVSWVFAFTEALFGGKPLYWVVFLLLTVLLLVVGRLLARKVEEEARK